MRLKSLLLIGIAFIAILLMIIPVHASSVIDDFEDGDASGWQLAGDSRYLSNYAIQIVPDGYKSNYALRLTRNGVLGWCGVSAPAWRKSPVPSPSAIALDARGNSNSKSVTIDVSLKDGSRWWCITSLPSDGSWIHIEDHPDQFFAVQNPNHLAHPDLAGISSLLFELNPRDGLTAGPSSPQATMDINNVSLIGEGSSSTEDAATGIAPAPAQSLRGITVFVADTARLPLVGQQPQAAAAIAAICSKEGAVLASVAPGKLLGLVARPNSVLIWEGPVCRDTDWTNIDRYLKQGGALVWFGGGLPFSQPVSASGAVLPATDAPARILSQGTFQSITHWGDDSPLQATESGKEAWPRLPQELPLGKCRFLALEDSIYRENNWPWVELDPLLTVDYRAQSWVAIDNSLFTGSVATLFKYHAGEFAGARVLLATIASDQQSPFSPGSPLFAQAVTGAVRLASVRITTDPALARIPAPKSVLTRSNYFTNSANVIGAIDLDGRGWDQPKVGYTVHRLGMNFLSTTIPWLDQPDKNGSVVDWKTADQLVADAKAGGWKVIWDGYCFGYGKYAWATDGGGKTTGASSIYNPIFRQRFTQALVNLARRYAGNPTVAAIFATPDTSALCFPGDPVDETQTAKEAWAAYASAHNLPPDFPKLPAAGQFDCSPTRAAYTQFWAHTAMGFVENVIRSVRAVAPDMPILLRGGYMDCAQSFIVASQFKNVAPHCECAETSVDVESYFRGFSERYGVPISGENGWCKEQGSALRMTFATMLLGGYTDYSFSFGGPLFARPGLDDFETFERVWPALKNARYTTPRVGLLIPDTTIWAANPPSYSWADGQPRLTTIMERTGIPFDAVSAQWPKLEGLSVLLDDGRNFVLRADSRAVIVAWVRAGGTFIAFPKTGGLDAAGGQATLASDLGIDLTQGAYSIGRGRVIVLPTVPSEEGEGGVTQMISVLRSAGAEPASIVSPYVDQAVYTKGGKTFLVLYNKSASLVGSFFNEHTMPAVESALPNIWLTASIPHGAAHARELVTGRPLNVSNGTVKLLLPATQYRVIEFSR